MFTFFPRIRRKVTYGFGKIVRFIGELRWRPRRLAAVVVMIAFTGLLTGAVLSSTRTDLQIDDGIDQTLAKMELEVEYLQSQFRVRVEELLRMQQGVIESNDTSAQPTDVNVTYYHLPPNVRRVADEIKGTQAGMGLFPTTLPHLRIPFVYQLLPHLLEDSRSLDPAYHMTGRRSGVQYVIGIPTVKREKESYLIVTLTYLIKQLTKEEAASTLIIVYVGEIDLEYVVNTARSIETAFPKAVRNGLIEVISPSKSYYPDLEKVTPTLGDSPKRVMWRTKQNLDAIYLMSYAYTKGLFYLMLEDDVVAKKAFMKEIKEFTIKSTVTHPQWLMIEFSHIGGIGKMFRSAKLVHLLTYLQLFYTNMPVDWLLESYLTDNVCTISKGSELCVQSKSNIKLRYENSLFQHIGLYSSLKGKIQKIKDTSFGAIETFFPHQNPKLRLIKTTLHTYGSNTLEKAYEGKGFFWGMTPQKGDMIEFVFLKPTSVARFLFRTGNAEHISDKLKNAKIEVQVMKRTYVEVGCFDEFGIAEGKLDKALDKLLSIRINMLQSSSHWVIFSEIHLETEE